MVLLTFLFSLVIIDDIINMTLYMNRGETMDIAQRIPFDRQFRAIKQQQLAEKILIGSAENGTTRNNQYQNGKRTPKEDLLEKISDALQIDSLYLSSKEKTDALDLVFTLFDWDESGLPIEIIEHDGKLLLDLNNPLFSDFLLQWANKKADLKSKKISNDDYIEWKINYTGRE